MTEATGLYDLFTESSGSSLFRVYFTNPDGGPGSCPIRASSGEEAEEFFEENAPDGYDIIESRRDGNPSDHPLIGQ